jgi:hypothetical protein
LTQHQFEDFGFGSVVYPALGAKAFVKIVAITLLNMMVKRSEQEKITATANKAAPNDMQIWLGFVRVKYSF